MSKRLPPINDHIDPSGSDKGQKQRRHQCYGVGVVARKVIVVFGFVPQLMAAISHLQPGFEALASYWPVLWRVAARGHYFLEKRPVRENGRREPVYQPAIPSLKEDGYTLSFTRGEANELSLLLSFPGPRAPMYPLGPYPIIAEFRAMLAALAPKARPPQRWDGEQFYGYVTERGNEIEFWFRAHANAITSGFPQMNGRQCGSGSARRGKCPRFARHGTP